MLEDSNSVCKTCAGVSFFGSSQLRAPMMTSLLRKLVIDVPALTENTVVPLRVGVCIQIQEEYHVQIYNVDNRLNNDVCNLSG